MDKLLHLRRNIGACRGEDIGILQPDLLAHETQHGLVHQVVFHVEPHRRALTPSKIFHIALASNLERIVEDAALQGRGIVHAVFHSLVNFLPEAGHGAHACGMGLAHALLDFLGIGIDDELCTFRQGEIGPATLKDMREGKEVDHPVLARHIDATAVGCEGGVIHTVSENDTLGRSRGATGVEDIADVIKRCLFPQVLNLRLAGKFLAKGDEVAKIEGVGIVGGDAHAGVEDHDALQRRAEGEDAVSLIVLLLFTDKDDLHLGILNHILNLLFGTCRVERYRYHLNAIGTEVGVEIMDAILGEDGNLILRFQAKIQHGIAHLFHTQ